MKQFTLREFQTDPMKCLKSGKCIITRYNIPVFMVTKLEEITQQVEQSNRPKITTGVELLNNSKKTTQQVEQFPQEEATQQGRCQNPLCKNEGDVFEGDYKEWNGDLGEWITRSLFMCKKCVEKFSKIQT